MEHSWLRGKELLQNVIPPFHTTLPIHRTSAITVRPWKSLCWRLFFFSKRRETRSQPLHITCHFNHLASVQWITKQQLRGKYSNHPGCEHTQAQVWVVLLHRAVCKNWTNVVQNSSSWHRHSQSSCPKLKQIDKRARISTYDFVVLSDLPKILPRCKLLTFKPENTSEIATQQATLQQVFGHDIA